MARSSSSQRGPRARPEYITVGRVVRPHGVRGTLLVVAISDLIHSLEPDAQVYLGQEKTPALVRYLHAHQKRYLLAVDGCQTREQAERWRGEEIFLSTADAAPLPEGTYYHWQILGLAVVTDEGESLGEIARIIETGANDVYLVEGADGEEILLPAIESVIQQVDLEQGVVTVHLLPGLRQG